MVTACFPPGAHSLAERACVRAYARDTLLHLQLASHVVLLFPAHCRSFLQLKISRILLGGHKPELGLLHIELFHEAPNARSL